MLCMRGHVSAADEHNGFHHVVAIVKSEFLEQVANFDDFTCIIKICYLFKNFTLCTCNNMTKTIVFTLQE